MSNLKGTFQDASGNNLMPIPSDSASIETSSTASQSYAVNDYFYYNNTLYKCTVAIAQGGTITPGTNCTATTTGGELSQLNNSLQDIDIRFNATDAVPEWRERGADSWNPFNSGTGFDWCILQGSTYNMNKLYYMDSKGNYKYDTNGNIADYLQTLNLFIKFPDTFHGNDRSVNPLAIVPLYALWGANATGSGVKTAGQKLASSVDWFYLSTVICFIDHADVPTY